MEERTTVAEQEARQRAERAGQEMQEAEQLRAKAQKLAPDLSADGQPRHRDADGAQPDQPGGGGATRR
jgi:hypothetical protein